MLGRRICDPHRIESRRHKTDGLGLLEMETVFSKEKVLSRVEAIEAATGLRVAGYEIHHGKSQNMKEYKPAFRIVERGGKALKDVDGIVAMGGRIYGTYIHGIFDAELFRRDFLNRIRRRKGWDAVSRTSKLDLDRELDKLASLVRQNLDMEYLYKMLEEGV
jgi:adenosylcobyric acid synthase